METNDHVMVVDDDAEIRRLLGDYLRKNGYRATAVADGAAMWAALARGKIDLIVLDLMLPGEDGLSLCRKLRSESDTPVIMLTARGEETDRVVGLEMGADDYLAKPFSARELLARVKSVLRRYRALPMHLRADDATSIRFSGWTLDVRARHLVSADGVVTPLSGAEFQLLRGLPQPSGTGAVARPADELRQGPRERALRAHHRPAGEPPQAAARRRRR